MTLSRLAIHSAITDQVPVFAVDITVIEGAGMIPTSGRKDRSILAFAQVGPPPTKGTVGDDQTLSCRH